MVTDTSQLSSHRRKGRLSERLPGLEIAWLVLLAPSILFPDRFWAREWHPYLVLGLFAFWPLHLIHDRAWLWRTPLRLPTVLAAGWLVIAVMQTYVPVVAWEAAGYVALGISLSLALGQWPSLANHPGRLVSLYLVLCGILALLGPLLVGAIPNKFPWLPRQGELLGVLTGEMGETVNPNVLAGALAPAVPLALALALFSRYSFRIRLVAGLLVLMLGVVVVLSQSRGSYVATAVGCLTVLLLGGRWTALAGAGLVTAAGGALWLNGSELALLLDAGMMGGFARRVQIWERALWAVRDFPLTGLGFGHFDLLVPMLYPYFVVLGPPAPHAHNVFLQLGVDMGVPGLVAMGALWVATLCVLIDVLRTDYAPAQHTLAIGILAALLVMWTHGLVDAVAWSSKLAFLPWLLYAVAASLAHRDTAHATSDICFEGTKTR